MKKSIIMLLVIVLIAGCTGRGQREVVQTYSDVVDDYSLTLAVTDEFSIRDTELYSGEMTRATLNILNGAENDMKNVRAVLLNTDALEPEIDITEIDKIEGHKNKSEPLYDDNFNWDLTAPELAGGEELFITNIRARIYYDNVANGSKILLIKPPRDREYESTPIEYTDSPIKVKLETSYETVTTIPDKIKNFTVSLVLDNQFNGYIDYYDNTDINDNYFRYVLLKIDKNLIFYNSREPNSPWERVGGDEIFNYYRVDFEKLVSAFDSGIKNKCEFKAENFEEDSEFTEIYEQLSERFASQRRILWMTRGRRKTNILHLGVREVEQPTEVSIEAEAGYSYSQDFGGEGIGVHVVGLG